jgi:hypothetical protein
MSMLAEVVDAVIGGDTHRDTHALEMATLSIPSDRGDVAYAAWSSRSAV